MFLLREHRDHRTTRRGEIQGQPVPTPENSPHCSNDILEAAHNADSHTDLEGQLPRPLAHMPKLVALFYTRTENRPDYFFHIRSISLLTPSHTTLLS